MPSKAPLNRWWVVFGAILVQLCLGAIYAWSVFTPALLDAGWSKVETQIVFGVGLASFAIIMVFAGNKLQQWGPRVLAVASGLTLGGGYLLAGLTGGTDFWGVLVGVGLVGGAGIGLGYVVPIAVGMRWFPEHKGMITGLAVAGFGFGAMGWVKLAGAWGNLIETTGLAGTFMIYGVAFAILVLLGSIWMVMPPKEWLPDGYTPPVHKAGAGGEEFSQLEILKTPQFYMIFLTFAVSAGAGLMSIGLMKLYPMEALQGAGYSALEASAIAGTAMAVFFSIANGIGRIVWGTLSDKLGRKNSVMFMAGSQGVILLLFTSMAGNEYLLYLGAALIGFNFGGNFALFPALTADEFGNGAVGKNYPLVFLSYGVGGILFPVLGGLLGDMGNFSLAFSICGIACISGAILIALVFPPHHDEAYLPFSVHGFLHQAHILDHDPEDNLIK
jgi:OFA family oxalate/formate antiporter-like MFS transporter